MPKPKDPETRKARKKKRLKVSRPQQARKKKTKAKTRSPKKRATSKVTSKKRAIKKRAASKATPKRRTAKATPKKRVAKKATPKKRTVKKRAIKSSKRAIKASKKRAAKKTTPKRATKKVVTPKKRATKKVVAPKKRATKKVVAPKKQVPKKRIPSRKPWKGSSKRPRTNRFRPLRAIALPREVLLSKLLDHRAALRKACFLSAPTPAGVPPNKLWRNVTKEHSGYHYVAAVDLVLSEENLEEILYKVAEAARPVEAALSSGPHKLFCALFLIEYGEDLLGSPKGRLYQDSEGDMVDSVVGTVSCPDLASLFATIRSKLERLLVKERRSVAIVEWASVQGFVPYAGPST